MKERSCHKVDLLCVRLKEGASTVNGEVRAPFYVQNILMARIPEFFNVKSVCRGSKGLLFLVEFKSGLCGLWELILACGLANPA